MSLELLKKVRGESAREYVTRVLKSNILNLNLKPGQSISEKEIAEELNVSRTPIREAFIKLSKEELLEVYPQKGTSVSLINMALVEEGRFVRKTLEKEVVKQACEEYWSNNLIAELEENMNAQEYNAGIGNYQKLMELDIKFHRIIFKACKKERTCTLIEEMNSDFNRVRMLRLKVIIDINNFLAQHREIKDAIKERNPVRAEKAMDIHLSCVESDQEVAKKEYPYYIKLN